MERTASVFTQSGPATATDVMTFGNFVLDVPGRLLEREGQPIDVSGRALDILIVLAGRAGEVVSKKEIMEQVWPDVVVDEGSLRFHVSGLRKALGDGRAGARFVVTSAGRGYCFVAPVGRVRKDTPQPPQASVHGIQGLPAKLGRMVGRTAAVRETARDLLRDRFITIVGTGVIGKTTVAICVAHELLSEFEEAVKFVDLGALMDPQLLPNHLAASLGLVVQSDDVVPRILSLLQSRRLLVILDSCEHVIDAAAFLAERIYETSPEIYILATSREPLGVEGEHVFHIPSLDAPPAHLELDLDTALNFSAVELFVERAAASGARFEVTLEEMPIVAEICRRLDGIPLAIELAAGRVRAYGVQETAALLDDHLWHFVNGRRTALPRHQTLGATLDWSYGLLSEADQLLLRRLSVFVGTFSIEAARNVAEFGELEEAAALDGIHSLVSKCLISAELSGAQPRYRLLDITRIYLGAKLEECGEGDVVARRHAAFYCSHLERWGERSGFQDVRDGFEQNRGLLGNVRAALEWCFRPFGDMEIGASLAAAAAPLFLELSLLIECRRWASVGIASLDPLGTRVEIELQAALGYCLMFTEGISESAHQAFTRGLNLAVDLNEPALQLRLLGGLHLFHQRTANFREATAFAQRSEVVAQALGGPAISLAASLLGISSHLEGDHSKAKAYLKLALERTSNADLVTTLHLDSRNRASATMARLLWLEGHAEQAALLVDQTIAHAASLQRPVTLSIALIWGISVLLWIGDLAAAEPMISRFSAQVKRHSLAPYDAVALGLSGVLLVRRGEAEAGIVMLRDALHSLHSARYKFFDTRFRMAIATGLSALGLHGKAYDAIDHCLSEIRANGDLHYMPEALRLKGEILLNTPGETVPSAQDAFEASLCWAKEQSALAWRLRSALSLARLHVKEGRKKEARSLLEPIVVQFTEGFEYPDLRNAIAFLRDLS